MWRVDHYISPKGDTAVSKVRLYSYGSFRGQVLGRELLTLDGRLETADTNPQSRVERS
jgi:hypothetical protein